MNINFSLHLKKGDITQIVNFDHSYVYYYALEDSILLKETQQIDLFSCRRVIYYPDKFNEQFITDIFREE